MTTPIFGIKELVAGQAEGHRTFNEACRLLEQFCRGAVLSRTTATPPGSPAAGDCYIVAPSPTGAWTGWEGRITYYSDGWKSVVPDIGEVFYVRDEGVFVRSTGGTGYTGIGVSDKSFFREASTAILDRWYMGGRETAKDLILATPAINTLYAVPFLCTRGGLIDKLGLYFNTAPTTSVRLAVYRSPNSTELYPVDMIWSSSEIVNPSSGAYTITGANIRLRPGVVHWLAYLCNGTAAQLRCPDRESCWPVFGSDNAFAVAAGVGLSKSFTYAAMPNPFPSGAAPIVANPVPGIFFQMAS